jgi:hypothetical protein
MVYEENTRIQVGGITAQQMRQCFSAKTLSAEQAVTAGQSF